MAGLGGTPERLRPKRHWEMQAGVAIAWVQSAADEALARHEVAGEPLDPLLAQAHQQVVEELNRARGFLRMWATPWTWWRGTRVGGAWAHIHGARVQLVGLLDAEALVAYSPRILALVQRYLKATDPERIAVKPWLERLEGSGTRPITFTGTLEGPQPVSGPFTVRGSLTPGPATELATAENRNLLAAALQAAYECIAGQYQRLRRFQSAIVGSAAVMLLLVGVLVAVGWNAPTAIPLCFPDPRSVPEPAEATEGDDAPAGTVCPSEEAPPGATEGPGTEPDSGDVATVVLFGLVGAVLTSVGFIVRRGPPSSVPATGIRFTQAVLKAATGMLTAVLGLLFLRAGVVPGFTRVDTRSQLLVYAVVFGAAQELVTRLIDSRSNELLEKVTAAADQDVASAGGDGSPDA